MRRVTSCATVDGALTSLPLESHDRQEALLGETQAEEQSR